MHFNTRNMFLFGLFLPLCLFIAMGQSCNPTKDCSFDCSYRFHRSSNLQDDCSMYILCRSGRKVGKYKCSRNRVFSVRRQMCVMSYSKHNDCPKDVFSGNYVSDNKYDNLQGYAGWASSLRKKTTRAPPRPTVYSKCGIKSSPNIVGGSNAHDSEWSWQVSIQYESRTTGKPTHVCGGVLISDTWVLTAAHCVYRRLSGKFTLVVNAHNLDQPSGFQTKVGVQSTYMHKKYQHMGSYPNDIALMKLADPIDLSGGIIREICLPFAYETFPEEDSPTTGNCWVTGWGATAKSRSSAVLQEIRVPLVNNTYCSKMWRGYVSQNHVCVGMGDKGACRGDSGGPLMCSKNGQYYLVGVSSWGEETCQEYGYPNIFTKVSHYIKWIKDTMSQNAWP